MLEVVRARDGGLSLAAAIERLAPAGRRAAGDLDLRRAAPAAPRPAPLSGPEAPARGGLARHRGRVLGARRARRPHRLLPARGVLPRRRAALARVLTQRRAGPRARRLRAAGRPPGRTDRGADRARPPARVRVGDRLRRARVLGLPGRARAPGHRRAHLRGALVGRARGGARRRADRHRAGERADAGARRAACRNACRGPRTRTGPRWRGPPRSPTGSSPTWRQWVRARRARCRGRPAQPRRAVPGRR